MQVKTAVYEEREKFIPKTSDLIEINKLNKPSNQFWSYLPAFTGIGTSKPEPILMSKDELIGNVDIYESSDREKQLNGAVTVQPLCKGPFWSGAKDYIESYLLIDVDKVDFLYRDAKLSATITEDKDKEIINFAGEMLPGARGLTKEEAKVIDDHILKLYKKL